MASLFDDTPGGSLFGGGLNFNPSAGGAWSMSPQDKFMALMQGLSSAGTKMAQSGQGGWKGIAMGLGGMGEGIAKGSQQALVQRLMGQRYEDAQARAMREKKQREEQEAAIGALPPEQQSMARANPTEFFKSQIGRTFAAPAAPPATVAEYEYAKKNDGYAGSFVDFQRAKASAGRTPEADPSNVREWQFFNALKPEDQQRFLIMKRANPFLDLGDSKVMPNPANPSAPPVAGFNKGTAPQTKIDGGSAIPVPATPSSQWPAPGAPVGQPDPAQSPTPGGQPGTPLAATDLPMTREERQQAEAVLVDNDRAIKSAEDLLKHPGRKMATGMSSAFNFVPGTDAYGFAKRLDTLKAQVFVPEVQKLKGMGALSNAEGEKITAAFQALDPGMKEEEFESSMKDALAQLQMGRDRLNKRLGRGQPDAPAQPGLPGNAADLQKLSDDDVLKRLGIR